jgi:hypothetical protein
LTLFAPITSATGGPNGIYRSADTGATWTKVSDAALDSQLATVVGPPASAPTNVELQSVDGQHMMRSAPLSDPANLRAPYRWTITTAAGETVGVIDAPIGLAPFIVQGSLLIHVAPTGGYREGNQFIRTPLRLRAIDVRSGAELWTVPVLDATFVLPPP